MSLQLLHICLADIASLCECVSSSWHLRTQSLLSIRGSLVHLILVLAFFFSTQMIWVTAKFYFPGEWLSHCISLSVSVSFSYPISYILSLLTMIYPVTSMIFNFMCLLGWAMMFRYLVRHCSGCFCEGIFFRWDKHLNWKLWIKQITVHNVVGLAQSVEGHNRTKDWPSPSKKEFY